MTNDVKITFFMKFVFWTFLVNFWLKQPRTDILGSSITSLTRMKTYYWIIEHKSKIVRHLWRKCISQEPRMKPSLNSQLLTNFYELLRISGNQWFKNLLCEADRRVIEIEYNRSTLWLVFNWNKFSSEREKLRRYNKD